MKALTIKEPWASLIIEGYKEYEFRSWKTNYRGKILIHAGLTVEKEYLERFKDYNIHLKPGYILGEVELLDCIPVTEKFENELTEKDEKVYGKSKQRRGYAWKIGNIKKYNEPIRINGKLGLWDCKI